MLREEKNLKDSNSPLPNLPLSKGEEQGGGVLYSKTNKLITALYMVTDVIDRDEPLRNKLRTLGTEIISDMCSIEQNKTANTASVILGKVEVIVSFLDLASTMNIVSPMNSDILKKEFFKLKQSIIASFEKVEILNKKVDLSEFFTDTPKVRLFSEKIISKGQPIRTGPSLGVQKAGTLLKAIKQVSGIHNFEEQKKQRRDDILNIIKILGGNATIKDIKDKIHTLPGQGGSLHSHSEKTLQRELVSMVSSGVLKKEGSKRWSRYFIK